jgi:D-alanyl-D-alanine carboxypeptidase
MKSVIPSLLCAAALFASHSGWADPADDAINREIRRQNIPGIAIGVVQDGKVSRLSAYGMANLELQVPVTPDTLFQTGSTGKQFASLTILMLQADGKLSIEDPLSRYFPDEPKSWADIKLKHLLSHTSGLDDNDSLYDLQRTLSWDALRKLHYKTPKKRPAGSKWAYSNVGYQLLGMVIEKVTGAPFHQFYVQRIFKLVGMNSSRDIADADIIPNRAAGYERADGKLGAPLKNQSWVSPTFNSTADGSTYVTARDYATYLAMLDAPPPAIKPLMDTAMRPVIKIRPDSAVSYGMAWFLTTVDGTPIQYHSGAWQGFRALIVHYPTRKASIVMLTNSDIPEGGPLAETVIKSVLPGMPVPPEH